MHVIYLFTLSDTSSPTLKEITSDHTKLQIELQSFGDNPDEKMLMEWNDKYQKNQKELELYLSSK